MKVGNLRQVKGFTLIEIMIVIAIVAVLGAIYGKDLTGYRDKGDATGISSSVASINAEIISLAQTHRLGSCASGNGLAASGNSILDVLYGGDIYVTSTLQAAFRNEPRTSLKKMLKAVTEPTAGTAGQYTVGGLPFSVQTCTTTSTPENVFRLVNVPSQTLKALLALDYPGLAAAFAPATAVTTGPLRYTAADSKDTHQVDFYVSR